MASSPITSVKLAEALALLSGNHSAFEHRIREIPCPTVPGFPRATVRFHYLTFRDGLPTVNELVEYLRWQIVPFCIPRREREVVRRQIEEHPEDLTRLSVQLYEKARDLFIKAHRILNRAGEPGELMLFVLLEWALKAPQIVSKMYLKTDRNMPVHGVDGIHAGLNPVTGELTLYWGESKLYEDLAAALDAAVSSVSDFLASEGAEQREIDLVRDHHVFGPEESTVSEGIVAYLNPYSGKQHLHRRVFACLAAFEFAAYSQLSSLPPQDVEAAFLKLSEQRIAAAVPLIAEKLGKKSLQTTNFEFFLVPFSSVSGFREEFYRVLGIK